MASQGKIYLEQWKSTTKCGSTSKKSAGILEAFSLCQWSGDSGSAIIQSRLWYIRPEAMLALSLQVHTIIIVFFPFHRVFTPRPCPLMYTDLK